MSDNGPEWFAPKRYGLGSGMPIAWQGWVVLAAFFAITAAATAAFANRPSILFPILVPVVVILLVISARTTRGGWRWRWGEDD
jgi:Na+-translocating ferredoxin:NAD+ oxidoreductase RnfD subunit